MLWRDPRDDANLVNLAQRLLIAHGGEIRAADRPTGDTQLLGDGSGGDCVVASDHAHLDASGSRLGDRHFRLGAWRIDDADKRQHGQVVHQWQEVGGGIERGWIEVAARDSHDTQALFAKPLIVRDIFGAHRVDWRHALLRIQALGGAGQQLVGSALHEAADDLATIFTFIL